MKMKFYLNGKKTTRKAVQEQLGADRLARMLKEAKEILMVRNHLTEEEAHKYLQKCSMDSGTNLVETAAMVLAMTKA